MKLGEKLRKVRLQKNYTQETTADFLDISQKTYSNIENDKSKLSLKQFITLIFLWEIDMEEFVDSIVNTEFPDYNYPSFNKPDICKLKEEIKSKETVINVLKGKVKELEKQLENNHH
jgi:transcriptional regulator with XRE-family HTH domain